MKDFNQKVAVITGAGSGLGREFARHAAQLGMKLVLADVQLDALNTIADELRSNGVNLIAIECDVRHARQVQDLADAAITAFGIVHLLFNNAGVGTGGLIWESTESDWDWVLGVNLYGVVHGVKIFTPLMLEAGKADADYQGHIVNTASVAGLINAPNLGTYNVAKHAVVALTETLYHDLRLVNASVTASVLCPYFVDTGIAQSERNRPIDLGVEPHTASQLASQHLISKAVAQSTISASRVAEITFQAIREQQFYIFTHPQAVDEFRVRSEDILAQRNPTDPLQHQPHLKRALRAAIKGGKT